MNKRILIVEDDPDLSEVLCATFQREGFRVLSARDGDEALALVSREGPDIVVLDLMIPGPDGLDVCRRIKENALTTAIPVLMLTARAEETDVVVGLEMGADDYVRKPASPRELVARVKTLLRRATNAPEKGERIRSFCDLVIDPSRFEARVGGKNIVLTPMEFRLLYTFVGAPGRVFRRQELLNASMDPGVVVDERNVDTHVKSLRKKLGSIGEKIETIRGVGYKISDYD